MTKEEFVNQELKRFDEDTAVPFRVAVSSNHNGGDYPYGSHAEKREYADTTVGYADSLETAKAMLEEAWEEAEIQNQRFRYPDIIPIRAKVEDTALYAWWQGKWRPICYYAKNRKWNEKWVHDQVLRVFRLNIPLPAHMDITIKKED